MLGECRSVGLEQNPVRDNLADLYIHSQSWTMQSTLDFEMN